MPSQTKEALKKCQLACFQVSGGLPFELTKIIAKASSID
jgi:hypothetical protein